jgi:hypothetical protein
MAVTTEKQFAPSAKAAKMSACIPAPDDGSDPPIDRMFTMFYSNPHVIVLCVVFV